MCKGICERDDREFDHVIPLRNLLKGQEQIFQMLCVGCHAEKTKLEPVFDKDPLASVFSKATYEAYVEQPQLPPLIFQVHVPQGRGGNLYAVDVVRCRRNALFHCAHPLPLFSPFDTVVQRTECRLYDFQFIDRGESKWRGPMHVLQSLPYTGPRWYPKVAAEFLLFHEKITWADIKLGLDASSHLAPDIFNRAPAGHRGGLGRTDAPGEAVS